jgi:hypothetical protein
MSRENAYHGFHGWEDAWFLPADGLQCADMMRFHTGAVLVLTSVAAGLPSAVLAQGTVADYQRAMGLRETYRDLTVHTSEAPRWIEQTNRFYYRRTVKGGHDWILVDGARGRKQPAFDHTKLAGAVTAATSRTATAVELPFTSFTFVDGERGIEFALSDSPGGAGRGAGGAAGAAPLWRCSLETYSCRQQPSRAGRGGRGGGGLAGPVRPEFDINGGEPRRSPDGKLEALVQNYNLAIREVGTRDVTPLTMRVGIYGTSAGGQNSLGALLFHPDFYKAAVSAAGCHDNRMDKIWWNEQWMGAVGDHDAESSNVEHAYRLQGKVLLVVGEMDTNVDPASTYQVVDRLIEHNKEFDLLVIPGAGHTNGGAYGEHKRFDFFARHLLDVTPPEWKAIEDATKTSTGTQAAAR